MLTAAEQEQYRVGVSPLSGDLFTTDFVLPGDLIRSESVSTVYCVTSDLDRRSYVDETTFFTHQRTFDHVKWVTDGTIANYPLTGPILPNPDAVLGKFETDPRVYRLDRDADDANTIILRHLDTEGVAEASYGPDWADYVIDINQTLVSEFTVGAPILQSMLEDTSEFRMRRLLNEESANVQGDNSSLYNLLATFFLSGVNKVTKAFSDFFGF